MTDKDFSLALIVVLILSSILGVAIGIGFLYWLEL